MSLKFVTLGLDLVEHAEAFAADLRVKGFSVKSEPDDWSCPRTPTLVGSSGVSRHFVEVLEGLRKPLVEQWISYCKCRQRETYFSLVFPSDIRQIKPDLLLFLREAGVDLYLSNTDARAERTEIVASSEEHTSALPSLIRTWYAA